MRCDRSWCPEAALAQQTDKETPARLDLITAEREGFLAGVLPFSKAP